MALLTMACMFYASQRLFFAFKRSTSQRFLKILKFKSFSFVNLSLCCDVMRSTCCSVANWVMDCCSSPLSHSKNNRFNPFAVMEPVFMRHDTAVIAPRNHNRAKELSGNWTADPAVPSHKKITKMVVVTQFTLLVAFHLAIEQFPEIGGTSFSNTAS